MPYIQFSLPQSDAERIGELSQEDESLGLTCKRLILEIIGGDRQSSPMPPDLGDRLADLSERMDAIEGDLSDVTRGLSADDLDRLTQLLIEDIKKEIPDYGDRLDKIEKHLDWAKREILDQRQKIKGLESDAYWNGDKKPETAIMVQKQPLPPAEIPLKTQIALRTEIARTHEEVALAWEKSLTTVKRWAKDPDKWPEGWLWDGDRQFWVKEA